MSPDAAVPTTTARRSCGSTQNRVRWEKLGVMLAQKILAVSAFLVVVLRVVASPVLVALYGRRVVCWMGASNTSNARGAAADDGAGDEASGLGVAWSLSDSKEPHAGSRTIRSSPPRARR